MQATVTASVTTQKILRSRTNSEHEATVLVRPHRQTPALHHSGGQGGSAPQLVRGFLRCNLDSPRQPFFYGEGKDSLYVLGLPVVSLLGLRVAAVSSRVNVWSGERDLHSQFWDVTVRSIMANAPKYDWPAILDEVCEWVASGRTVLDYSRQEGKPSDVAIYQRAAADEEIGSRITRARAQGADRIAEGALDIADTPQVGVTITVDKDGEKRVTEDMLGHRKLQVETRLKLLAKWNSGRYGDKAQVEHSGKVTLDSIIAETLAKNAPPKAD